MGDYDPSVHSPGYASEFRFVSAQTEELEAEAEAAHAQSASASSTAQGMVGVRGMQPAEAERAYLDRAKWMEMYGVDLHPVLVSFETFSLNCKLSKLCSDAHSSDHSTYIL